MATPFGVDDVLPLIEAENFTILSINTDDPNNTSLIVVHDLHPETEATITLKHDDNEENMDVMEFNGPDEYTEEEAKQVLQEVMNLFIKIIEGYSQPEEGSESGSASASGSNSGSEGGN